MFPQGSFRRQVQRPSYDYYDEYDYYLSFDDNEEYLDRESEYSDVPTEQQESSIERSVEPLHDDDPWCED